MNRVNRNPRGVSPRRVHVPAAWVWRGAARHLGMPWFLQAINPYLEEKKKKHSAAGLSRCYGCFMDCAHPISSLIKHEQCGDGGSGTPHSPQDYFAVYSSQKTLHCALLQRHVDTAVLL